MSIGGNNSYDEYVAAAELASQQRTRLAVLAIPDRREAVHYLTALASEVPAVGCLVLAGVHSPGWLVLAFPLGIAPSWYFNYLAQRTQRSTAAGDYFVGPRLALRASAISLGSLTPRALELVRNGGVRAADEVPGAEDPPAAEG